MSNKVVMETTANVESDFKSLDISLVARGSFCVLFSQGSEIQRMLDVKNKEKFRITIERMK